LFVDTTSDEAYNQKERDICKSALVKIKRNSSPLNISKYDYLQPDPKFAERKKSSTTSSSEGDDDVFERDEEIGVSTNHTNIKSYSRMSSSEAAGSHEDKVLTGGFVTPFTQPDEQNKPSSNKNLTQGYVRRDSVNEALDSMLPFLMSCSNYSTGTTDLSIPSQTSTNSKHRKMRKSIKSKLVAHEDKIEETLEENE